MLVRKKVREGPHVSVQRESGLELVPLDVPTLKVGYGPACLIQQPGSRFVGRVSAVLVYEKQSWWLVAKSPFWNPVCVDGSLVKKKRRLNSGVMVTARDLRFRFSEGEDG